MIFSQIMVLDSSHGGRISYICYFQVTPRPKKTISWHFMYNWDILMLNRDQQG